MTDYSSIHIESSLPKPWEEERTFNDVLYDWMSSAPWLAISAAAHVVVFLILMAIPWDLLYPPDQKIIQATIEQQPEDVFEEPPPEEPEEIEEEPLEEPVIKDAEISDHNETEDEMDFEESLGDPDMNSDSQFESDAFNDVIGIGGGAGGKFGNRFGGRRNLRAAGGAGTEQALKDGLEWLKNHQSTEGYWDCDDFMNNNALGRVSEADGPGEAMHDVGMTGLALLAFLGDGNTTREGIYKEQVAKGINWLKTQQDPDLGLLGERVGHSFIYNHTIATLAICEAYYFSKNPILKRTAQESVAFITRARNPYGAWRYDYPPTGENDTSVTGWALFALTSGKEGGLKVDGESFEGGLSWIDEVTDSKTGRTGYDTVGSLSSRVTGVNDHYPAESGETMTAVSLLCRFFLGHSPDSSPIMNKQADLLLTKLPEWDPDGLRNDMYYWYYGSYAMFQMGKSHWDKWNKALKPTILESQRKDGDFKGSWDPRDAWGQHQGGRVYMTALGILCLEVYFRYAQVLGAR